MIKEYVNGVMIAVITGNASFIQGYKSRLGSHKDLEDTEVITDTETTLVFSVTNRKTQNKTTYRLELVKGRKNKTLGRDPRLGLR